MREPKLAADAENPRTTLLAPEVDLSLKIQQNQKERITLQIMEPSRNGEQQWPQPPYTCQRQMTDEEKSAACSLSHVIYVVLYVISAEVWHYRSRILFPPAPCSRCYCSFQYSAELPVFKEEASNNGWDELQTFDPIRIQQKYRFPLILRQNVCFYWAKSLDLRIRSSYVVTNFFLMP